MDDEIILITRRFQMDELNQQIATECYHRVWCRIESVSRAEWRDAGVQGLQPELMAVMPICNYGGELIALHNGIRYAVYRTYRNQRTDEIELYLSREVGV